MQDKNILDVQNMEEKQRPGRRNRIIFWIELALWVFCGLAWLWFLESWPGREEGIIFTFTMLALFYLGLAIPLTKAVNKPQKLIALSAGLSWALHLLGVAFILLSWEGGRELQFVAMVLEIALSLLCLYLLWRSHRNQENSAFYVQVLVRMALINLVF